MLIRLSRSLVVCFIASFTVQRRSFASSSQAPSAVGGACADASCEGGGEEPKEGSRTERRERLLVTPPKAALDVVGRLGSGNGAKLTPLASRLANSRAGAASAPALTVAVVLEAVVVVAVAVAPVAT